MLDDTRELLPDEILDQAENATWYKLRENVATIIGQRMTRVHTSSWADSLRFLTFDDGHDHEPQEANQNTPLFGQCQPCQERLPLPAGHVCEKHLSLTPTARIENREAELHKYADPCVHVREHSCNTCQHIPLFPNEGKATKFRIRRVNKVGSNEHSRCDHFVAVSYCWSAATANRSDNEEGPYKVVEEDGSVRDMRAAKSTIDRVVTFARENGFRLIWIDQECIEQDNPEQQELAIQAMDNVYLRAHTSIGLFNAELNKEDLNCLQVIYEYQGKGCDNSRRGQAPPPGCQAVYRTAMYKALSKVANDRWNTRAWILQEAFASSGNMFLLFPRLEGIDVGRWMIECFHPGEPGKATILSAGTNKPRRTCNAAVALTFLKLRGLLRVPDKLAILANMCGYHVRFNTIELEKTQDSLSACVIALSVINNDFSLLVPEFYRVPSNMPLATPSHDDGEFSWVHSLSHKTPLLQISEWNPFGAFSLENVGSTVDLSYNGLSILGHLWEKDRFISLESLQIKHARSWEQLRTGKGHSKPDGETVRLATTHIMFKIIELLASKGEKELADSILNSTSNRYWNSRSDLDDMIESVDEFPPGLQVENRAGMFALDSSPDGRYHQSWIIDRVMEQGGLWSWALVNNTPRSDLTAEPSEQGSHKELEKRFENYKHSKMLIISSMLSRMGEEAAKQVMSENPGMKNSLMKHSAAGSIMALYMTKVGTQGPDMGRRRATFDVDVSMGGAFVLTPFQMVLESLPRPSIRGVSVSWVVEETDSRFDVPNRAHEEKERCFKVKGMARGMWRFILLSTGRYTLV
ncbi:HET domain-containing protein [Fusarium sp. Ph1]|nr:HET domain-containing protein [Fusarium sp. Ph1]